MRRELAAVALIAVAAFAIRLYPAWQGVIGGGETNFLETDAWYHLRLVENQVRNFPWRVSFDPYAAPDGQFVPIAPLYDTLTAVAVVAVHGRDADPPAVARIAAFLPPIFGTLAVVVVWAIGRRVFGRRPALLSATMLTVLPGHFMDRTMLGFVDHHALEALLSLTTLLTIVIAIGTNVESRADVAKRRWLLRAAAVGVSLGLYLLAWASGAFLVAIVAAWLVLVVALERDAGSIVRSARATGVASLVALMLVVLFQHHQMYRFGSQVVSLVGLGVIAAIAALTLRRTAVRDAADVRSRWLPLITLIGCGVIGALAAWVVQPALMSQLLIDVGRLAPDPSRMGVLEARPLFTYPGEWNWMQPWQFFRTGFYIGVAALIPLGIRIWRQRRAADILVWTFTAATIGATIGQNRFGYYMVPACALVGGWLAHRILEIGDRTAGVGSRLILRLRQSAGVFVVAAMIAPSLPPRLLFMPRTGMFTSYWLQALDWLRDHSDPPFDTDLYYYAPYGPVPVEARYTVMNWWDQGYYLIQRARRVPVSNPTQERAPNAARFYTETDEARALGLLARERSRYVLADWELPFRLAPDGSIAGRFQTLADWAGVTHAEFYEIAYRRSPQGWIPVWLFYEPYYRSMVYRLAVLGGASATPVNATSVVTLTEHTDSRGFRFREVVTQQPFPTYDAALGVAKIARSPNVRLAGLDPWQAAFPVPALTQVREVHQVRTPEQKSGEAPWVRVFQVQPGAP